MCHSDFDRVNTVQGSAYAATSSATSQYTLLLCKYSNRNTLIPSFLLFILK